MEQLLRPGCPYSPTMRQSRVSDRQIEEFSRQGSFAQAFHATIENRTPFGDTEQMVVPNPGSRLGA